MLNHHPLSDHHPRALKEELVKRGTEVARLHRDSIKFYAKSAASESSIDLAKLNLTIQQIHTFTSNILFEQRRFGLSYPSLYQIKCI